jgi:hypothetical protein
VQVVVTQAKLEREVSAAAAPAIAPPVIDFELARISEDADSGLPESINFDLQMPDMSKVHPLLLHKIDCHSVSQHEFLGTGIRCSWEGVLHVMSRNYCAVGYGRLPSI